MQVIDLAMSTDARGIDRDADLLRSVRRGDRAFALCALMQRHGVAVYRYCQAALHNDALANDVHQQVFIDTFRHLSKFRGESSFRSWLFGFACHRVLDAARSGAGRRACMDHTEIAELPGPLQSRDESTDDARLRYAVSASLSELSPRSRAALLLRYQQGFTFNEMAEITGEKPGTLQARITCALPQLRARIEARTSACPTQERISVTRSLIPSPSNG